MAGEAVLKSSGVYGIRGEDGVDALAEGEGGGGRKKDVGHFFLTNRDTAVRVAWPSSFFSYLERSCGTWTPD